MGTRISTADHDESVQMRSIELSQLQGTYYSGAHFPFERRDRITMTKNTFQNMRGPDVKSESARPRLLF